MSDPARLPIFHHPDYQAPLETRHRFPMGKYGALREALIARGLMKPGGWSAPGPASAALISKAHDRGYVSRVFALDLSEDEQRRIGLPRGEAFVRRARLASAGTLLAAETALSAGIACNMAGGSHHAGRGYGSGFCTFNDVAVAAAALLEAGRIKRCLVVDCDAHQGDGTAEIFSSDDRVFTLSIHGEKNFPARKIPSDLDIGLADGTGDDGYAEAQEAGLNAALSAGPFDLAFYNAGVDVHRDDRLGRLALSDDGLRRRDRLALTRLRDAGTPVVTVLGGGYGDDPAAIAARHAITFEVAAAVLERGL